MLGRKGKERNDDEVNHRGYTDGGREEEGKRETKLGGKT